MNFTDWLYDNKDKPCSKFTLIYIGEDCKARSMIDIMREQSIFTNMIFASEEINYTETNESKDIISSASTEESKNYTIHNDNALIVTDMCSNEYLRETVRAWELLHTNGIKAALISTNDSNIFYGDDFASYIILLDCVPTHTIEIPEHRIKTISFPLEIGKAINRLEDGYYCDDGITIGNFIKALEIQLTHY